MVVAEIFLVNRTDRVVFATAAGGGRALVLWLLSGLVVAMAQLALTGCLEGLIGVWGCCIVTWRCRWAGFLVQRNCKFTKCCVPIKSPIVAQPTQTIPSPFTSPSTSPPHHPSSIHASIPHTHAPALFPHPPRSQARMYGVKRGVDNAQHMFLYKAGI